MNSNEKISVLKSDATNKYFCIMCWFCASVFMLELKSARVNGPVFAAEKLG